jgi:hypothetical protein
MRLQNGLRLQARARPARAEHSRGSSPGAHRQRRNRLRAAGRYPAIQLDWLLIISQFEMKRKKSMDFLDWQDARRQHSELCNDEGVPLEGRNSPAEKDAIHARRFNLTDYQPCRRINVAQPCTPNFSI